MPFLDVLVSFIEEVPVHCAMAVEPFKVVDR